MEPERTFVATDPVTNDVLWVCSGADAAGRCPLAGEPPYVCQGLRVVAARGTRHDGTAFIVGEMAPGRCPAAWIDRL